MAKSSATITISDNLARHIVNLILDDLEEQVAQTEEALSGIDTRALATIDGLKRDYQKAADLVKVYVNSRKGIELTIKAKEEY